MSTSVSTRHLVPAVDKILSTPPVKAALATFPRWVVLQETRRIIDEVRQGSIPIIEDAAARPAWLASLGAEVVRRVEAANRYSLQRVINATGVVLHTNMGRAPLAQRAIEHVVAIGTRYSNLELDLETGERGHRYDHVDDLVCALTGAEAAIVVNNNAAAVVLCLSELAGGNRTRWLEVIVSRGELVEIGGSFRVPEIMQQSGCRLISVGTTNRTHLRDYESAITPETALLLKVHTSNFRIIGFTSSVPATELAALAKARELPFMNDLGAGCLVDMRQIGLPHEPTVQEAIKDGADVVTFSGDKLLGGPQLGVIAGKRELIDRLKKHQLLRAFRVDKLTLAAFEATLRVYRDSPDPIAELPGLRMLRATADAVRARADAFAERLGAKVPGGVAVAVVPGSSQVGAGSAPGIDLPTYLVTVRPKGVEVAVIEGRLRRMSPAVMVRVHAGDLIVDLRTIYEDEEAQLLAALLDVLSGG